jgi:hypothetical protein
MKIHTLEIKTPPKQIYPSMGDCVVILEAPAKASLYDLAEAILDAIDFDNDHAFAFCDNLRNPYRSDVKFTLFADMGEEDDPSVIGVSSATVTDAFPKKTSKMVFHFDYGDDWVFLVTCKDITESDSRKMKITTTSVTGTPPVQYPDYDDDEQPI